MEKQQKFPTMDKCLINYKILRGFKKQYKEIRNYMRKYLKFKINFKKIYKVKIEKYCT